ncbi:hypothetical protein [uncultured Brachyspira sp.]|uniref:hypothetical protein n=1 Tax=uncultured Brachyspira sp. TaxID=221953 RepID=UPI002629E215|nr:hypothetical protein [uncultured Brachyspira sp.]
MKNKDKLIADISYLCRYPIRKLIANYDTNDKTDRMAKVENFIKLTNGIKKTSSTYQNLVYDIFQYLLDEKKNLENNSSTIATLDYSCDCNYILYLGEIFFQNDMEAFRCWECVFAIVSKSVKASKFGSKPKIESIIEESNIQYFVKNYKSFNNAINFVIETFDLFSDSGFKYAIAYDTIKLYRFYRIIVCNIKAEINRNIISYQNIEPPNYYNEYNFIYYLKDIVSNRLEITHKQVRENIESAKVILALTDELTKNGYDISELTKFTNELSVIFEKRVKDYSFLGDYTALDEYNKTEATKYIKSFKKIVTNFNELKNVITNYIAEQNEKIGLLGNISKRKLKLVIKRAKINFTRTEYVINDCIEKTDTLLSVYYEKQLSRQNTNFHCFKNIIFTMLKSPDFMENLDAIFKFYLIIINYLRFFINGNRLFTDKKVLANKVKFIDCLIETTKTYKHYRYILNGLIRILSIELFNECDDSEKPERQMNYLKKFIFDICKNNKKYQGYIEYLQIDNMVYEISLNEDESTQNKRKILSDLIMMLFREKKYNYNIIGKHIKCNVLEYIFNENKNYYFADTIGNLKLLIEHIISFLNISGDISDDKKCLEAINDYLDLRQSIDFMINNYEKYDDNLDEKNKYIKLIQPILQKRSNLFDYVKDELLKTKNTEDNITIKHFNKVFQIPRAKVIFEIFYMIENYLPNQDISNYLKLENINSAIYNLCEPNLRKRKSVENFAIAVVDYGENSKDALKYILESKVKFYSELLLKDCENHKDDCIESLKRVKNIQVIVSYFFDSYYTKSANNYSNNFYNFVSNSLELEEALNFIVANNLSPEKEFIIRKAYYFKLLKSKISDKHFRNIIFLLLNSIRDNYDLEISFCDNSKDKNKLFFYENSKSYIDELEDIINNKLYYKFYEKETIRNLIYMIAILNNKENSLWTSLLLNSRNNIYNVEEVIDDLIIVRENLSNFDREKDYAGEIKQLEDFKNYLLPLLALLEKIHFLTDHISIYEFIENKNKLEDYIKHMIFERLSNSREKITKKIEGADFIISLIDKNDNYQELLKLILSNLRNEINDRLNSIENYDLDSYYLKMNDPINFIDELEKNLCCEYNYKEYLNNYKEKEEIIGKIFVIAVDDNFENEDEEIDGFKYFINKIIKDENKFKEILNEEISVYEIYSAGKEMYEQDKTKVIEIKYAVKKIKLFKEKIFNIYEAVKNMEDKASIGEEVKILIMRYNNSRKNLLDFIKNWSFEKRRFWCSINFLERGDMVRENIALQCLKDVEFELKLRTEDYDDKLLTYNYSLFRKFKSRVNKVHLGIDPTEYFIEYKIMDEIKDLCNKDINEKYHDSNLLRCIVLSAVENPDICELAFNDLEKELDKYSETRAVINSKIETNSIKEALLNNKNEVFELVNLVKDLNTEDERRLKIEGFYLEKYHLSEYLFDIASSILKLDQENFENRIDTLRDIFFKIKNIEICGGLSEAISKAKTKLKEKIETDNYNKYEILYNTKCLEYFDELSKDLLNNFNNSWLNQYYYQQKILSSIYSILNNKNSNMTIFVLKTDIVYLFVSECYDSIESVFNYYESICNSLIEINKQSENIKEVNRLETLKSKFKTLVSELKPIIEKFKNFDSSFDSKSLIEFDLINEEEINSIMDKSIDLIVDSLDKNEKVKNSIELIYEIDRFKFIGYLYRNSRCDLVAKIIENKIKKLEKNIKLNIYASLNVDAINGSITLEYLNYFKENIVKTEKEFNYFCDFDFKLWLYLHYLKTSFCYVDFSYFYKCSEDSYKDPNDLMINLIILFKEYSVEEINRAYSNITNIIKKAYKKYKYAVCEVELNDSLIINKINSIKNYTDKVINYINCDDIKEFKLKLYDIFKTIRIISTIYFEYECMNIKMTTFIEEQIQKLAKIVNIYGLSIITFIFDLIYVSEKERLLSLTSNIPSYKFSSNLFFNFERINKFIMDKIRNYSFSNEK